MYGSPQSAVSSLHLTGNLPQPNTWDEGHVDVAGTETVRDEYTAQAMATAQRLIQFETGR